MPFDPDKWLAKTAEAQVAPLEAPESGFNPDEWLATQAQPEPEGFDPDQWLETNKQKPADIAGRMGLGEDPEKLSVLEEHIPISDEIKAKYPFPEKSTIPTPEEFQAETDARVAKAVAESQEQLKKDIPVIRSVTGYAKGILAGLTLGISRPALKKLEKSLGIEGLLDAESTGEQAIAGVGNLIGTILTGAGVAGKISKLKVLQKSKLAKLLAVRLGTTGVIAGTNNLVQLASGQGPLQKRVKQAGRNFGISMGAAMIGILPEQLIPAGVPMGKAANWAGQVLTDLAYDFTTDKHLKGRLKDQSFREWFLKEELVQLAPSIMFATRDLTDPDFEATRKSIGVEIRERTLADWRAKVSEANVSRRVLPEQKGLLTPETEARQKAAFEREKPGTAPERSVARELGLEELEGLGRPGEEARLRPRNVGEPDAPEAEEQKGSVLDTARAIQEQQAVSDAATINRIEVKKPVADMSMVELKTEAKAVGVSSRGTQDMIRGRIEQYDSHINTIRDSSDPIEKLIATMQIHKLALPETKFLRRKELAKRFKEAEQRMDKLSGQDAIRSAKGALKNELPLSPLRPVNEFFDRTEIDALTNRAKAVDSGLSTAQRINAGDAIARIMNGEHLREFEIKLLGKVFGPQFAKTIRPLTNTNKASNALIEGAGFLRTLKTMLDVSAIGRQGAIISVRNPMAAGRAIRNMAKGLFSQERYDTLHDSITADPRYAVADEARLYIAPKNKDLADMNDREEAFMSGWADKIPGAKISERAFNGYLNSLRADVFYKFVDKWGDTATLDDYTKLASFINKATGRGGASRDSSLGRSLEDAMPLLAQGFFSPRWALSRIQAPFSAITPVRDADTNKLRWSPANTEAIKSMGSYYGLMLTVLAMAKAAGAEVEDDPRSSDFAKVKIGNTRVDLSAGMQQYWRFLGQAITHSRKNLGSGHITELDKGKLLSKFARSKVSPAVGLAISAFTGKTYNGDEFIPVDDQPTVEWLMEHLEKTGAPESATDFLAKSGHIAVRELFPLILQQTIEGMQSDGPLGGLLSGASEFVGVSAQSFIPDERRQRAQKAPRTIERTKRGQ